MTVDVSTLLASYRLNSGNNRNKRALSRHKSKSKSNSKKQEMAQPRARERFSILRVTKCGLCDTKNRASLIFFAMFFTYWQGLQAKACTLASAKKKARSLPPYPRKRPPTARNCIIRFVRPIYPFFWFIPTAPEICVIINPMTDIDLEENEIEQISDRKLAVLAKKKLPEEIFNVTEEVVFYISQVGLEFHEACKLANTTEEEIEQWAVEHPLVNKLLDTAELYYKKELLKSISKKAKSDDKAAQWLIERRYPEEYGSKAKKGKGKSKDEDDIVIEAIQFIQEHGDSDPLASKKSSGKMLMMRRKLHPDEVTTEAYNPEDTQKVKSSVQKYLA